MSQFNVGESYENIDTNSAVYGRVGRCVKIENGKVFIDFKERSERLRAYRYDSIEGCGSTMRKKYVRKIKKKETKVKVNYSGNQASKQAATQFFNSYMFGTTEKDTKLSDRIKLAKAALDIELYKDNPVFCLEGIDDTSLMFKKEYECEFLKDNEMLNDNQVEELLADKASKKFSVVMDVATNEVVFRGKRKKAEKVAEALADRNRAQRKVYAVLSVKNTFTASVGDVVVNNFNEVENTSE